MNSIYTLVGVSTALTFGQFTRLERRSNLASVWSPHTRSPASAHTQVYTYYSASSSGRRKKKRPLSHSSLCTRYYLSTPLRRCFSWFPFNYFGSWFLLPFFPPVFKTVFLYFCFLPPSYDERLQDGKSCCCCCSCDLSCRCLDIFLPFSFFRRFLNKMYISISQDSDLILNFVKPRSTKLKN